MSDVIEVIYGRNEAESFANSKSEEWILAGQESSWQNREALPYCHSAHEGSFLQHTAVTPAPEREDEPVWRTLLPCGRSEKPEGVLEYFVWRWSWLLGRMGLDCVEASCKGQCVCMVWSVCFHGCYLLTTPGLDRNAQSQNVCGTGIASVTVFSSWSNRAAPVSWYLQCQRSSLVFTRQLWKTLVISSVHFSSELILG